LTNWRGNRAWTLQQRGDYWRGRGVGVLGGDAIEPGIRRGRNCRGFRYDS